MLPNRSPVVILALAVALLVTACATPTTNEGVPPEVETTAPLEVNTTLPPDAATEGEPAGLASTSPAGEEQPPIANEVSLSSEEIAEKLRMASADGASEPVLIFSDDFSSPGWLEFDGDEFTTSYVDGAYELSVIPGAFSTAFGLNPSLGPLTDFYFQIETRAYGPADNGYGIRFRAQEAGFYEFTVSSGGTFSIDKFVEGSFERIVPFKSETPSIVQGDGELNVLGVLALGPDISLYISGQEVARFNDPHHRAGSISLRVNPYFEGVSRTLFDNVAVWVPVE